MAVQGSRRAAHVTLTHTGHTGELYLKGESRGQGEHSERRPQGQNAVSESTRTHMLGMEHRKGMLYEVILVKDEGHSRIWGQRARVTPTWGPRSLGDCMVEIRVRRCPLPRTALTGSSRTLSYPSPEPTSSLPSPAGCPPQRPLGRRSRHGLRAPRHGQSVALRGSDRKGQGGVSVPAQRLLAHTASPLGTRGHCLLPATPLPMHLLPKRSLPPPGPP